MRKRLIRCKQGNTSDVLKVRPCLRDTNHVLDSSWVCRIKVRDAAGDDLINRVEANISHDQRHYIVALTPAETAILPVGDYLWIIQVENENTLPPFVIEEHRALRIEPQYL